VAQSYVALQSVGRAPVRVVRARRASRSIGPCTTTSGPRRRGSGQPRGRAGACWQCPCPGPPLHHAGAATRSAVAPCRRGPLHLSMSCHRGPLAPRHFLRRQGERPSSRINGGQVGRTENFHLRACQDHRRAPWMLAPPSSRLRVLSPPSSRSPLGRPRGTHAILWPSLAAASSEQRLQRPPTPATAARRQRSRPTQTPATNQP
jgi:hypothetical protein